MVSYNVIVGDTITKVVIYYFNLDKSSVWSRRELIIGLTTLFLTLPLSLHRGMAKFARFSLAALLVIAFVMCAVFVRVFTLGPTMQVLFSFKLVSSPPHPTIFLKLKCNSLDGSITLSRLII